MMFILSRMKEIPTLSLENSVQTYKMIEIKMESIKIGQILRLLSLNMSAVLRK